jgi:tRNA 2-thiouridine synthesizing protein A
VSTDPADADRTPKVLPADDGRTGESTRRPRDDAGPAPGAELVVDAVGLRCPLPIIRLAAAARSAAPGTVITLTSTDPAAEPDVAAWCRMRNQTLLDQSGSEGGRILTSRIRTTAPTASPRP